MSVDHIDELIERIFPWDPLRPRPINKLRDLAEAAYEAGKEAQWVHPDMTVMEFDALLTKLAAVAGLKKKGWTLSMGAGDK